MHYENLNYFISVGLYVFMLLTLVCSVGLYAVYKTRETRRRVVAPVSKPTSPVQYMASPRVVAPPVAFAQPQSLFESSQPRARKRLRFG